MDEHVKSNFAALRDRKTPADYMNTDRCKGEAPERVAEFEGGIPVLTPKASDESICLESPALGPLNPFPGASVSPRGVLHRGQKRRD